MLPQTQPAIKTPTPIPGATLRFVRPATWTDRDWGWELYKMGRDIGYCRNAEQEAGWEAAEAWAFSCYVDECIANGIEMWQEGM